MAKTYQPSMFEEAVYRRTLPHFAPKGTGEPFSVMMPPPNVTGTLHLGHALNSTLQDILVRHMRLRGKQVLWQPGCDHAGIATQVLVEKQLMKKGTKPADLGREEFIKKVWEWKEHSGGAIGVQLRRLGISPHWARERFTLDEGLCESVLEAFCRLHKQGLIYRGKHLVNWDVELGTAVSDLEVENRPVEGELYHISYKVEGGGEVVVATTRPETMAGDTAIAVHPEDARYKKLIGKQCTIPVFNRKIQIIADEHADPAKGSGAVKITPAHDFNDFEVGKRHNLEMLAVFDAKGCYNANVPPKWQGLDRTQARKQVLEALGKALVKTERTQMAVPYGDRSGSVIEPFLSDQWFVDAPKLAKAAIKAVQEGKIQFFPKHWEKTYFDWLNNIRPWCISRRLWWGHRIPAWYDAKGNVYVAKNLKEAQQQAAAKQAAAKKSTGSATDKTDPSQITLTQDEDVLDTWFSSALWPFSTLGWPKQTEELATFYPTSVLVTGFDIIFFWVARMVMMGLHFTGKVPFKRVYVHALVRDEKGQKMSKSKGNVIDPLELINRYGADSVRFTLADLSTPGRDVRLSEKRVQSNRNFITKVWNAARFLKLHNCHKSFDSFEEIASFDPFAPSPTTQATQSQSTQAIQVKEPANLWISGILVKTANQIDTEIKQGRFDNAAHLISHFTRDYFCDWYLEFAKQLLSQDQTKQETQQVAMWCYKVMLQLLNPFAPLVTEHLWGDLSNQAGEGEGEDGAVSPSSSTSSSLSSSLGNATGANQADSSGILMDSTIKLPKQAPKDQASKDQVITPAIECIKAVRALKSELGLSNQKITLAVSGKMPDFIARYEPQLKRLAGLAEITAKPTANAVPLVGFEGKLHLAISGDIKGLIHRLEGDLAQNQTRFDKLQARLANQDFTSRAAPEVVQTQQEQKQQLSVIMAEQQKTIGKLKSIC